MGGPATNDGAVNGVLKCKNVAAAGFYLATTAVSDAAD